MMEDNDIDLNEFRVQKSRNKKRALSESNEMEDCLMQVDISEESGEVQNKDQTNKKRKKVYTIAEQRKITVPPHRYTPLKENWLKIFTPIVEHLQLQIRFNLKTKQVSIIENSLTFYNF